MCRPVLILGVFAVFVAVAYSQVRIIHPTYRPPPQPRYPRIRIAREADYTGTLQEQRPEMLSSFDQSSMEPNARQARSLSTPGRGRGSGSSSKSSGGHDTGPTHPGYNRRNAREARDEPVKDDVNSQWPSTKDYHQSQPSIFGEINLDPSVSHAGGLDAASSGIEPGSGERNVHISGTQGYNHRNTRSSYFPTPLPPFNPRPRPWNPPQFPIPMPERPRFPIYA